MTVVLDHSKGRPRHPEKAHRPDSEVLRKPDWIRVKAPTSAGFAATRALMRSKSLTTVCEEAACPNIGECWSKKHATVMILGDTCTRACAFCNVKTGMPRAVRHMNCLGPLARSVEDLELAGLDVDGEDHFRGACGPLCAQRSLTLVAIMGPAGHVDQQRPIREPQVIVEPLDRQAAV